MSAVEIVIIVVGIVLFIASFLIPEKKGALSEDTVTLSKEAIQKLVEEEKKNVQDTIEDKVEETVSYQVEKTERALERLSNEKIMAVEEYSETVLKEINKTHEEVVFLYDMLNDKHTNLKDAAAKAEEAVKTIDEAVKKAEEMKKTVKKRGDEASSQQEEQQKEQFAPFVVEKVAPVKKAASKKTAVQPPVQAADTETQAAQEPKSKNEMILELHEQGKSNMAIAKELGLGLGEVKLVIDLYTGQE